MNRRGGTDSIPRTRKPMSTAATNPPPSITVISHTSLIYWWPVWLVGLVLAGLTYLEGDRSAVVPAGTQVKEVEPNKVYQLTLASEPSPSLKQAAAATAKGQEAFPVHLSRNRNYALAYLFVVLAVIFGSNVPFRGLASLVAILALLLVVGLFAYLDWWGAIFDYLGGLHVEISMAGYLLL